MTEGIIIALISSVLSFAGVCLTVIFSHMKTAKQVEAQAELTRYRIGELEKKQEKHNTLIERMYKVEKRVGVLEERVTILHGDK